MPSTREAAYKFPIQVGSTLTNSPGLSFGLVEEKSELVTPWVDIKVSMLVTSLKW